MHPAPLVYDQQIYTPPENPIKKNPPKKEMLQKKQTVKDQTPEEADPPTYHPQVPEGHEQLAAPPKVQQIE